MFRNLIKLACTFSFLLIIPSVSYSQDDVMYDYEHKVGKWYVLGWHDATQATCGAATSRQITKNDYLTFYKQVWQHQHAILFNHPIMSYWSMWVSFEKTDKEDTRVEFDVDKKFHLLWPYTMQTDVGGNSAGGHEFSFGDEGCATESKCGDRVDNTLTRAIAAELKDAKYLYITFHRNNQTFVRKVDVSDFGAVEKDIDQCIDKLMPDPIDVK